MPILLPTLCNFNCDNFAYYPVGWIRITRKSNPEAIQKPITTGNSAEHNTVVCRIATNEAPRILIDNSGTRPTCTFSADLPREAIRGYPEPDFPTASITAAQKAGKPGRWKTAMSNNQLGIVAMLVADTYLSDLYKALTPSFPPYLRVRIEVQN